MLSAQSGARKKKAWPKQLYCVALRWLWKPGLPGWSAAQSDHVPASSQWGQQQQKRTKNKRTKWSVGTYCMRHNKSPRFDNLRLNSVTLSCFPAANYVSKASSPINHSASSCVLSFGQRATQQLPRCLHVPLSISQPYSHTKKLSKKHTARDLGKRKKKCKSISYTSTLSC